MAKSRSDSRGLILRYCLLANLALWAIMWVTFVAHARRYEYRAEPIEGPYPWQVVFGWAISPNVDPINYFGYKLAFVANFPSYVVTLVSFNLCFHGQRMPEQYLGTTVGGYELIVWMLLSFVQWYAIALLVSRLWRRFWGTPVPPRTTVPPAAGPVH